MESPAKRQKVLSSIERTSIICSKQTSETYLTKSRDDQSICTLVIIARIRNSEYDKKLFYHRDCRSKFTHKKTLLQLNKEPDSEPRCSSERRSSRCPATTSRVLDPVCIFCEKESKYVARSNTRETLLQSRELRSDETIRRVAQNKLDHRMLAITARDLVAAEAHYHKSCYRKYTRGEKEKIPVATDKDDESYQAAEEESYVLLFQYVRETLFPETAVVRMTELTVKSISYLQTCGINDVKPHTKKQLRRKLECEFKESLHFVHDDKGKLLVYPDNLSFDQVVVAMVKAEEQLQEIKYCKNIDNIVKLSADHLRGQIKKINPNPWPPNPAELNSDYTKLPESLEMFLKILHHGETKEGTKKMEHVIQSIGQDCIYAISRGNVIPAKHVLLPWGVKSLTGNVELIKMLSCLGHGISYLKLEETDTTLCHQKQRQEADQGIVLPSSCHPHITTSLAFDNIDRLEETLIGRDTSH